MLNAILCGKTQGTGLVGIRLSDDFEGAEDTLTSTVFERLLYLPDDLLITILFDPHIWVLPATRAPREIRGHEFWPWWGPPEPELPAQPIVSRDFGSPNGSPAATEDWKSIVPDLVIEFDDRVLIVEAKRWDLSDMQKPAQLAGQYDRALDLYGDAPAWLLAVGGLPDGRPSTKLKLRERVLAELRMLGWKFPDSDFHFAALAWHELFNRAVDVVPPDLPGYRRLIVDMRKGTLEHGIRVEPFQWLEDLTSIDWRNSAGDIAAFPATFVTGLAQTLLPIGISPSSIITLAPRGT